jgi:hypothetical protein
MFMASVKYNASIRCENDLLAQDSILNKLASDRQQQFPYNSFICTAWDTILCEQEERDTEAGLRILCPYFSA